MDKELSHIGVPRRSGRYPWGSGKDPQQRNKSFLGYVDDLRKKGMSDVDIAKGMGISTTQLRIKRSLAKDEKRKSDVAQVARLSDKGYSNVEIGKRMGIPESSVRSLRNPVIQERSEITRTTANMLKDAVEKKRYIDVGVGVERYIGVSRTKLNTAVALLKEEGYKLHFIEVKQLGTGKNTSIQVLTKGDVEWPEVNSNKDKIKMITDHSEDGGTTFYGLEPVRSIDSKRVQIRYHEDGGTDKDGVIELRRGVEDLNLGQAKYAQVRIAVDGSHYLKGMAMYNDNLPKGVDVIYNTNKAKGTPKEKVFKKMEKDKDGNIDNDNPFGSSVRQKHYKDSKGNEHLSALNIVGFKDGSGEEGAWGKWSKTLSSQILSKQPASLAKKQLGLAYDIKKEEFDEIMALTNPAVKKKLLEGFAADADAAAVHLKAAALPRQKSHIILPLPDMKETEVYAPNYRDGERVVLIRHPHGGIFEIPELTVNNRNAEGKRLLGQAQDAVGINPKVAERLSGADFDGDSVLVIPNDQGLIKNQAALKGLMEFNPREIYKKYDGMKLMDSQTKAMEMGNISNLITDMTIGGAKPDEIAAAVRHSMVVIDAEKHELNYKQSALDNGISGLKKRYQGSAKSGASTLISKASSQARPGVRKERIDPATGKKVYEYTNETYINKKGKIVRKTIPSTKMAEIDDAFKLSSGTPMESVYATHANKLKGLANTARKEAVNTKRTVYSSSAREAYAPEVSSLNAHLNIALKNAPLERQAQIFANTTVSIRRASNPHMDKDDLKKLKNQAQAEARNRFGAKKRYIEISPREWEAIQAGAVSNNVLKKILDNTDMDKIKQLATPRTSTTLTPAKELRARLMLDSGRTQAEVADALGLSTTTINKLIN